MATAFNTRKRIRRFFGHIESVAPMPNLIEVQKSSYEGFLQRMIPAAKRTQSGLQEVFRGVFPIKDFAERASLEFVKYEFEEPKYDVEECQQRGITYAAPLKVTLQLVVWDIDEEAGSRSIRDIKEQDVYMGDMPLMTDNGTFIVNGTERVIVSQIHRSPGVFFDHDKGKTHSSGKYLFAARIIPYRGSWLDFEFDAKDRIHVRIDRRRNIPVATLLLALDNDNTWKKRAAAVAKGQTLDPSEAQGMSPEEILAAFYGQVVYKREKDGWNTSFDADSMRGVKLTHDLINAKTGKAVADAGAKLTPRLLARLKEQGLKEMRVSSEELIGRYAELDVINEKNGEIYVEAGQEITQAVLDLFDENEIDVLPTLAIDHVNVGPYIRNTLAADKNSNREEALLDIYRVMRPGEPPTLEQAETLFQGLLFDIDRYDLSPVGRVKMNMRLDFENVPDSQRTLRREDILAVVKVLHGLKDGRGEIDDIDHLGNRRVRSVGELMENQYRVGLLRMERAIRERMSSIDIDTVMPHDLINAKPAAAAVREFFGSSQLSQFMDQTNPLSEVTHKRRLSALGPGGLTRERAGFEVRDVHPTHYGRICPIETPEGPNIGLIASLSTFARVNEYGFVETPYRQVVEGKVTDEVKFYSALEEEKHVIAQANATFDKKGHFLTPLVSCRKAGEFPQARPEDISLMDVSPNQLVSVAASLIPFLENDDANRALMGSNMQRQAVPLLRTTAPLVGTGIEGTVARDSGVCTVTRRDGVVDQVDASRIVVRADTKDSSLDVASEVDIYNLTKYQRSNQNTCINQKPIVKQGDRVRKGDVIADGPATETGELALGQNVVVAFMPWQGYNFEDSILISERIVKEDVFTSIHIEEFECIARDTKLGKEEITRDIPNVGEEALKDLDDSGIIRIGAEVGPGSILVGKITPKGETQLSPEEKLLRAIFGEKAGDVRDSSLRVPPGVTGTVINAKVFSRKGVDKDERAKDIENQEEAKLLKDQNDEIKILKDSSYKRIKRLLHGKETTAKLVDDKGHVLLNKGQEITDTLLDEIPEKYWPEIAVGGAEEKVAKILENFNEQKELVKLVFGEKISRLKKGDELPPGVIKMVKVYVAIKRKLAVGDKMAGRHGNKGVVSRVLAAEDMPYLEDGRPVDLVLNPLGVPSRMNIGQILETHLGWAARGLGEQIQAMIDEKWSADAIRKDLKKIYDTKELHDLLDQLPEKEILKLAQKLIKGVHFASPVFDGAREVEILSQLEHAGLPKTGQMILFDGRTGEAFDQDVTVGIMYMLKLHHLVDEKIHARSIGPYSLVTQQPLGGKAQFGGQRLGEMEVWAMEAYGAAYGLQEFLTVKSDDVVGRTRMYEAIVKGEHTLESGLPESFNVLLKELQSLCLNVELIEDPNAPRKQESTLELMAREVAAKVSAGATAQASASPAPTASELGGE